MEHKTVRVHKDDALSVGLLPHPRFVVDAVLGAALNLSADTGDKSVAEVPALLDSATRQKPSTAKRLLKGGKKTVGATLLLAAYDSAPSVYDAVVDYFNKSGVSATELAESINKDSQAAVVDALLKKGMTMSIIESAGLSQKELGIYSDLIQKYHGKGNDAYAAAQARSESTGSVELDRIAVNLDIERICVGLGISSELYATVLRGINTHTPSDIEAFQLHRRAYGMRSI